MPGEGIIVIAGPTAAGKSDVAIKLAKDIDGQIVSADSMQVYRGMDIGTAKVPPNKREVSHYCIDILDPGEPYSAALFQRDSREAFEEIRASGSVPILCGGTGFYIRASVDEYDFPKGEQVGNPVREKYSRILEEKGPLELWKMLEAVDRESAQAIHPNNSKRVIRAFELIAEGESYASQAENLRDIEQAIPAHMFVIDVARDELRSRIDQRVDRMREDGLVSEVESLLEDGFESAVTSPQAIGYKEVASALKGECSLDDAFEKIKTATKRYAKRQRSWFRSDARYMHVDGTDGDVDHILEQIHMQLGASCDNS